MVTRSYLLGFAAVLALAAGAVSSAVPSAHEGFESTTIHSSVSTKTKTAYYPACTNDPRHRGCWFEGFDIDTDFDTEWPNTGNTVIYEFEITNQTMTLDGVMKNVQVINKQYPGPTIYANWGDMISVVVKNSLQKNGTGLHFHGMRQYHSNQQDGVPGVTECPIPPGGTRIYKFRATQHGTSWYHSHWSSQYGEGVRGAMLINGPATANYDEDLGTFLVEDLYYESIFGLAHEARVQPQNAPNGLINGTMVSKHGGHYLNTKIEKGKRYRLRFINGAVDNMFQIQLDQHPFLVISADLVPVVPFYADWLFLAIGQRYDVIIEANQTIDNYWFRAEVQSDICCHSLNPYGIRSVFSYEGAPIGEPTSRITTNYTHSCNDTLGLVPHWDSFLPKGPLEAATNFLDVYVGQVGVQSDGREILVWGTNFSTARVDWSAPLRSYVRDHNTSYPHGARVIPLAENKWYYWVMQAIEGDGTAGFSVAHPMHLHGHDFYILGTGSGNFTSAMLKNETLINYKNPPRRDTAMLPEKGWLVIAFETNNPGAWIMHCHVAWHAADGLAVNFLYGEDSIDKIDPLRPSYDETCKAWKQYYPAHSPFKQDDSGI